jgi:hypothetical protein
MKTLGILLASTPRCSGTMGFFEISGISAL